ncbi:hypothetical protein V2G26_002355 [Clonostachys chloroleuca]
MAFRSVVLLSIGLALAGSASATSTTSSTATATATSPLPSLVNQMPGCDIHCFPQVGKEIGCDTSDLKCLCEDTSVFKAHMGTCLLVKCSNSEYSVGLEVVIDICLAIAAKPDASAVKSAARIIKSESAEPSSESAAIRKGHGVYMAGIAALAAYAGSSVGLDSALKELDRAILKEIEYLSVPIEGWEDWSAIITGLNIALGLSLASNLNKLAKDIRWWILSRRYRSRRKVEAILQVDNVLAVLRLALTTPRITVHAVATLWVTLLLIIQVALAIIGLFYSIDPSDKLALIVFPGNVSVANMSAIQPFGHNAASSTSRSDVEYTSNIYGTMGLAYPVELRNSEPVIGDLRLDSEPVIFCDREGCDLVMLEFSVPSNPQEQLADFASWRPMAGGDGTATEIEYKGENDQELIRFAVTRVGASRQTSFMTETSAEYGSGCKTVHVLETSPDNP